MNENDATATDEITFGDNDALAAQVAVLTNARLLVLLTEVDGVYSRAPGNAGAELLDDGSLTSDVRLGRGTGLGRGGMGSKIAAAQLAAGAGIPTVIASGQAESVLVPIVAGERRGTRFDGGLRQASRRSSSGSGTGSGRGERVVLDAGAERAVRAAGRASSPSASRRATAASARETRSSSCRRTASRSARASPRSPQPRSAPGRAGSRSSTATGSSSTRAG